MYFPDLSVWVEELLLAISSFVVLSVLLVGILNEMKELVSDFTKKHFFIVSIIMGCFLMVSIVIAFPWLFPINIIQAIFFGSFVGLGASGFYKLGVGNTDKKKDNTSVEDEDFPAWGMDRPDPRDWHYWAVAWSDKESDIPSKYDIAIWLEVQNQGIERTPSTYMACGGFGKAHLSNAMNLHDDGDVYTIWEIYRKDFCEYFREDYKAKGVNPYTDGSRMQDHLRYARHLDLISWWVKVITVDDIKANIARDRGIYTGSNKIDRKATKKDNIAVIDEGSAHIFGIIWYDDDTRLFKCVNSYWPKVYEKWYFYLRYEDIGSLFSMYALIDVDDEPLIEAWIRMRDEILDKATKKINEWKKLTVKEKIALRQRGFSHLIPKSDA